MSNGFLTSLAVAVAVVLAARAFLPFRPARTFVGFLPWSDAVVLVIGLLGLVLHCAAMFFPSVTGALPGTGQPIRLVNALGGASIAWYVVAAALVMAGLRRQSRAALAVLGAVLTAVGITMFDGGSLNVHLAMIFTAVVALVAVLSFLVRLRAME